MNATLNDSASRPIFLPTIDSDALPPNTTEAELPIPARTYPPHAMNFFVALGWIVVLFVVAYLTPGFVVGFLKGAFGIPMEKTLFSIMLAGSAFGIVVGLFVLRWRLGKSWLADVGLNRLPLVPTLLALACVPGLKVLCGSIAALMTYLFAQQDPALGFVNDTTKEFPWWLSLLSIAVAPALIEELWFRGIVGRSLVGRYGALVGVLLASLLFGVFHMSVVQGSYAFALGIAAHLTYRATGSLWVPILVHFAFNAMAVGAVLLLQAVSLEAAEEVSPAGIAVVIGFLSVAMISFPFAVWGLYRMRDRQPEAAN